MALWDRIRKLSHMLFLYSLHQCSALQHYDVQMGKEDGAMEHDGSIVQNLLGQGNHQWPNPTLEQTKKHYFIMLVLSVQAFCKYYLNIPRESY